jgi:hypothetical protein
MLELTIKATDFFFDRPAVIQKMSHAKRRAMSRQLAFIRTNARTKQLRRRKKSAPPGQPPSVHAASGEFASLKNILFAYDAATQSGIVGPVKANQVNFVGNGRETVPSILERGGTYKQAQVQAGTGRWYRSDLRRRVRPGDKRPRRVATIQVAPHPFMKPALQSEIDSGHIMEPWANVVTA